MNALRGLRFNTIFWKIFLSYWLVMVMIVAATFVAVALLADRDRQEMERRFSALTKANALVSVYEHGGVSEATHWLQRRERSKGGPVYLLDEGFVDLLGKPVPEPLKKTLQEGVATGTGNNAAGFVQKVTGQDERIYWVVGLVPPRHPHRAFRGGRLAPFFPFRGVSGVLALLVTGLISYLLARHLTSPVRQLQKAAQGMAAGDLAIRVAGKVGQRRDELGDLARDFNAMADEIERLVIAQKRMLRDVSHELRSPLARLQVALGLARKAAGEACEKDHDRIEKEVGRLDELIGQVISLVRLESSAQALQKAPIDLKALLAEVVEDARFEGGAEAIGVSLQVDETVEVQGDAELLHSALENVVRNAVAYTPAKSKVAVQLARTQQQVVIKVTDQGPGVAEAALESLFEPFYREADARDRASGGYGLGLAIAQRAIRLHGGEISAQNHPDGGLEVEIRLPL
ncbi:MAG: ATP-binding protein [Pseudomonadales bacterium]